MKASSEGWYEKKHDYWTYINFMLYIIKAAYVSFSNRLESIPQFTWTKTDYVITQIKSLSEIFTIRELINNCPAISKDLVRKVVKNLQKKVF